MELDAVADDLYGLRPELFTAARNERTADAKRAGDAALAASIKKLARPTKSAWLVNTVVRQRRERVEELVSIGQAMRDAQENLAGGDLRELSRRRHEIVGVLAQEAPAIARESGEVASAEMVRDLTATLEAALAQPASGETVLKGCLTDALSYAGFGSIDLASTLESAAEGTRGRRAPSGDKHPPGGTEPARPGPAGGAASGAARATVRAAEKESEASLRELEAAARDLESATATSSELTRQIAEREREIAELRRRAAGAAKTVRDARHAHDAAERTAKAASARLARLSGSARLR